ncbi:MAG: hypothetical protein KBC44_01970, partial [Candidatus Pacebacteria bacterium]|nr:hypothetical protein [Candidatus Paceibacterota bacterium]
DRKLFNETVYTPLTEAIKILEERQKDSKLREKVEELLKGDIPEPLKKFDKYAINNKQVATPNFDTKWFIKLTEQFNLKPYFSEYLEDKFTSNNPFKHSLGQIIINKKLNTKGESIQEKVTVIDFNKSNGVPINQVKTLWGENLVDFHRRLFDIYQYKTGDFIFYDVSNWLKRNGAKAEDYYKRDMLLLVCHGILFENFLLDGEDGGFSKNVLLPAIEEVEALLGCKPLITPIPPMDIEDDNIWYSYDEKVKLLINLKN